jgi:hypothetical protein
LTGLAPPRWPLGADTYERIACADGPRSYHDLRHTGQTLAASTGATVKA